MLVNLEYSQESGSSIVREIFVLHVHVFIGTARHSGDFLENVSTHISAVSNYSCFQELHNLFHKLQVQRFPKMIRYDATADGLLGISDRFQLIKLKISAGDCG